MRLSALQNVKAIYRVTGTPENYLTALRSSTWGFKDTPQLLNHWKKLQTGDIIFFHSQQSGSHFLKSKELSSRVVGFGVVGSRFYNDTSPLWIEEFIEKRSIYPHRFHFSEIYFFADIPPSELWDSQTLKKKEATVAVLKSMLAAGIPLKEMPAFPKMGSYSGIKDSRTKAALIQGSRDLYAYRKAEEEDDALPTRQTEIREVNSPEEIMRFATGLSQFDDIGVRIRKMDNGERKVDIAKLQAAEKSHAFILQRLLASLKERGYQCYSNNHIDLLGVQESTGRSLLIEAKSNENLNFHAQARKGISQLFEYNYFEVNKFKSERSLQLQQEHSVLAFSQRPQDTDYIGFINSLKIRTIAVTNSQIAGLGDLHNFSDLAG